MFLPACIYIHIFITDCLCLLAKGFITHYSHFNVRLQQINFKSQTNEV